VRTQHSSTAAATNGTQPTEGPASTPRPPSGETIAAGSTSTQSIHPVGATASVAETVRPLTDLLFGTPAARVEFWDGSAIGPSEGPGTLYVRSPAALRRILWAPGELGLSRAFIAGDLDYDGDLFELIKVFRPTPGRIPVNIPKVLAGIPGAMVSVGRLGLLGRPLPPPPEEARLQGGRHTKGRDAVSVGHHYDAGNDFYRLLLGETMTYSCARFVEPTDTLAAAQSAKHELVCRKLGLDQRGGQRLLDVGCGWGTLAMHAARHHGAQVVGITISRQQASLAQQRVHDAGLDGQVDIRLQDYRDLGDERFDAISSIGMFEHVGKIRMAEYFSTLHTALRPTGRLLNHAISSVGGSRPSARSFTHRYMFPDGELMDVGDVALAMEAAGFEVRDVESLREHYALTVRHWVANLDEHWDEIVGLIGDGRARVWLLYMTAARVGFEDGGMSVHQVLGVVPGPGGESGMPPTRRAWN
jgi:cyclopropane-fatty-acyl-phospholipid synthase